MGGIALISVWSLFIIVTIYYAEVILEVHFFLIKIYKLLIYQLIFFFFFFFFFSLSRTQKIMNAQEESNPPTMILKKIQELYR